VSDLLVVGLAGFLASLVDGALGMGFGPTSSSILLSSGLSPAAASTTVNIAKVATGLVAAVSHWRFRNIDHRLVLQLAIPGALGALIGTSVLVRIDGDDIRPMLAVVLLVVGVRILVRFARPLPVAAVAADGNEDAMPAYNSKGVEVAAAAGGITNGLVGAWGPVVTPFLLHRGLSPRFAVGSVNTAEVAVAMVAAGSLISSIGRSGLEVGVVLAMLIGGMLAAPLAAYVVRFVHPRALGLAVAGLLLVTQARELATYFDVGAARWIAYVLIPLVIIGVGIRPLPARAGGSPTPALGEAAGA